MTDCNVETKQQIWSLLELIEIQIPIYFQPEKINIASFANYILQVHWYIMARFKNDSFYPECIWDKKQCGVTAEFASMDGFITQLLCKIG